ncbi:Putative peptidoglycan binding domain-containing protein [Sporolactobacillus nakayamae]|uniref:Putative peptidoglycan binding domain-containing protein n=2 Tax=Sporolactobacillus nakayamae TaxID=269670 RepID=A0A1I2PDK3_9BACL|nr:Putative peptidoglycan binding domain-containing protein [Sporolactobacillus nakayamae]
MIIAALVFGIMSYYQATHFNANVAINGIKVSHMKPEQALKKLTAQILKNDVFIGNEQIINGKNTMAKFSQRDLKSINQVFNKQRTWWPSFKTRNYALKPATNDDYRSDTLKKQLEARLNQLNKKLKAPKDAYAYIENGDLKVSKSEAGKQYDVKKLMRVYDKQEYNSEIYLPVQLLIPIKADSKIVKDETSALKKLMTRQVSYKVQDKSYDFKASELIKKANVSANMKITVDSSELKNKVAEINKNQSTLNKRFNFKTHSGRTLSIQGQSYGWALNVSKETTRIKKALETGKESLKAYNVYGVGYSTYGIGYHNTTNNGIGTSYAEVSIAEQKIWIYKNGKLVISTDVVTGRHDTNEDTPKGLWYVMYKESPSTLEGSEAGNAHYSVKVDYWAPFTMSGCGFHDASWRRNWKKDAYLTQGSGGCVNTPPSVMKTVYDNLEQNEPVVIY